jgi:hypothetical protein
MKNTRSTAVHFEQSGTLLFHIAQYRVAENTVVSECLRKTEIIID